jgi:hypothetical protein
MSKKLTNGGNMKKYSLILMVFVLTLAFTSVDVSATESIYGHVSLVEGNPKIVRTDNTQEDAVVNLPIAPGDVIATGKGSRCEIQFDNGTVMRLGKNTQLKVITVLAPSLTSRWKITTLELLKGKLYSINQSYNKEKFQIITPNAAVHLKNNSISTIDIRENDETHFFSDHGKFQVMYGNKVKSLKTETVKKGQGFLVTTDDKVVSDTKRDIDFLSWNQYIDKNYKDLHYGVSKLPAKIYKYPKGLVHWAERWSTLFGEWVYDELFGYVWKPADEQFAYSARPFFHAKFTTINNELFLVPSQPWGWAPAHMGTWVWMKWGWTWVPGSAFSNGIWSAVFPNSPQYQYSFYTSYLGQWMRYVYGSWDHYYRYRRFGYESWAESYRETFKKDPKKPSLQIKKLPVDVRVIVKKLNKTPIPGIQKRLGEYKPEMNRPIMEQKILGAKKGGIILNTGKKSLSAKNSATSAVAKLKYEKLSGKNILKAKAKQDKKEIVAGSLLSRLQLKSTVDSKVRYYRDFNPDKRWALRRGVNVLYSSKTNEVVCPKLGITSGKLSPRGRHALLKTGGSGNSRYSGKANIYAGGGEVSPTDSSRASTAGSRSGGSRGGGGGPGSSTKEGGK